jgi:peptidoglycan/xylan/chitin deacetylase (PgdA/CDA1 family)
MWLEMTGRLFWGISAVALFLIACGGLSFVVTPTPTATPTWMPSLLPSPTASQPATVTPTPSAAFPTHTPTLPPTETPLPTLTFTPTLNLEPQWVIQGPGDIIVPILLYHHIGFSLKDEQVYYVSPEMFDQQMNLLYQWGYKTISVQLLAQAIHEGAELPSKPILLTFDDGSETTYTTALPIMQRYNFTGVSYIVYYYVGLSHYMSADQIRALYGAGWEIGSHGLSHKDLTLYPEKQENEIVQSRHQLESLLGVPVLSFAYPFGAHDESSLGYVHLAGYIAAMGLGNETLQGNKNLFYLYRQAVRGTDDLRTFASRLPWRQDQYDLPAVTIVP